MNKIYEQAKDLHVRSLVVFGKAADHKLYANADFDKAVAAADVLDAFKKGMLVIDDNGVLKRPVSVDDGTYATVEVVSSAVAVVEWTVYVAA